MGESENQKILDPKRFMQYEKSVIKSTRLTDVLEVIDKDGMKILDVGGASGIFLNELSKRTNHKVDLYNFEVDDFFEDKQLDEKIKFIHGSILNNNLEENFFDIVTFGDVLHHLIGNNLKETVLNQYKAVYEIFRITKKGGYIIFSEEVNKVKLFSLIVYLFSKLAYKLKLNFRFFETGKMIILFATPKEINSMVEKAAGNNGLKIIKKHFKRWNMSLKWKLTLLMGNVGHMNYTIKKISDTPNPLHEIVNSKK